MEGGWRAEAPRLRIGLDGSTQQLDGLLLAGGQHFALAGDNIDATALLRGLALTDRIDPGLPEWLHDAAPPLPLTRVLVAGASGSVGSLRGVPEFRLGERDESSPRRPGCKRPGHCADPLYCGGLPCCPPAPGRGETKWPGRPPPFVPAAPGHMRRPP